MLTMKRPVYSIMVVDDHPIIHEALGALLATEDDLSIDATATSADQAMEILDTLHPDLIIVDLSLGASDGTYLIQRMHNQYPKLRILVYTMSEEKLFAERVAGAGARGYVMKTSAPSILKKAIYSVIEGHLFFPDETKTRILKKESGRPTSQQSTLDNLSNREMDVFKLIGEGLNTSRISKRLNISKNTVDTHRINIRKKLELTNGKALDRFCFEVISKGNLPKQNAGNSMHQAPR